MAARIPLPTFFRWMEYANCKPFGEERADLRMAIMASSLVNIQLDKSQRPTRPIDFMPFSKGGKAAAKQTPAQMSMLLKGVAALHKQQTGQIAAKKAPESP